MQQIDFYAHITREKALLLSLRQQLIAVASVVVICVALGLFLGVDAGSKQRLSALEDEQLMLDDQLQQMNDRREQLLADKSLEKELEQLKSARNFRLELLRSVKNTADLEKNTGFSPHLTGLANQHVSGLWFTEIDLLDGGSNTALKGLMKKPELLPRYLKRLASEEVFAGQNFDVFRISRPEDQNNLLAFEIKAPVVKPL